MTDDDKLHSHLEHSEEEAEFEAAPRASKWEGSGKQELHYLLPLKGKHGRLILQEPTLVPTPDVGKTDIST